MKTLYTVIMSSADPLVISEGLGSTTLILVLGSTTLIFAKTDSHVQKFS